MDLGAGEYEALFKEEQLLFAPGIYHFAIGLSTYERSIHYVENIGSMVISDVPDLSLDQSIVRVSGVGLVLNSMDVKVIEQN